MDELFFTEEHVMLRDMVRDFAKNEVAPVARELDRLGKFPKDLIKQMGELGLMGIPIPEKYGGSGMDTVAYATAVLELAKVDASVAITMAAHTSLGTVPIVLAGTDEQKEEYVPQLASGAILGAFGLTEPGAGSDSGAPQTTAVKNGDGFVVNGSKIFITNAGVAGVLNFTAQVIEDGEKKGIGAFTISTKTRGVKIESKERKMGWRASDTRQIYFEDLHVSEKEMLGSPADGFKTFLAEHSYPVITDSKFNAWFEDSQYYNDYNPANTEKDPISGMALDITYTLNKKITLYSQLGFL